MTQQSLTESILGIMTQSPSAKLISDLKYSIKTEEKRLAYLANLEAKLKEQGYLEEGINLDQEKGFSEGRIDAYKTALEGIKSL